MTDPKTELERLLTGHARAAMPALGDVEVKLDRPREAAHGDYATNVALAGARVQKRAPREVAQAFVALAQADAAVRALAEAIDIAGPGFVNLRLSPAARQSVVKRVLAERGDFGRTRERAGERIMVEFVSANPTGPLHVGHGRQAALGDAISSLLEAQGASVTREFYYNDAGQQIHVERLAAPATIAPRQRGHRVSVWSPRGRPWPARWRQTMETEFSRFRNPVRARSGN